MDDANYRWVEGHACTQEEWDRIDRLLEARGWMSINRETSRILLAEGPAGELLGFHVFQLLPFAGPLYVIPSARGTGIADMLVVKLLEFLAAANARGFIAIAQSKHAERKCIEIGMQPIEAPVYVLGGRA